MYIMYGYDQNIIIATKLKKEKVSSPGLDPNKIIILV